jgi:hypothetical protein
MKVRSTNRNQSAEEGIALLISIFMLLLISVVAIALVVSSGTESALAGNYRSSTSVYYAALSGLEEARGRLLVKNPDAFNTTNPVNFLPPPGTGLSMGNTYYLINPVGGEAITPWDSSSTYPDNEFNSEFFLSSGFSAPTNPSPTALSVWKRNPLLALNLPGPLYKWVRINAVSEKSLNRDTYPYDGTIDPTPVYYDGAHLTDNISAGPQVLELTAQAVLPNGSQKLVQYLAAPIPVTLPPLPAALTLAGNQSVNKVTYKAPSSNAGFVVDGRDHDCSGNLVVAGPKFPAVGVFDSSDTVAVISGIPNGYQSTNYPGNVGSPDVVTVNGPPFPTNLQTPSALDNIVQPIIQNADVILTPSGGPVLGSNLTAATAGMSSSSPMTVVINGDLDLTGWHNTGYGLLLVTGTLNYDPDASWDGIVLVIGQGIVTGSKGGNGLFLGAFLVSSTRDSSGNLRPDPTLGPLSVNFNNGSSMGGNGILYSSCWIQKSQPSSGYKILSFHEIAE